MRALVRYPVKAACIALALSALSGRASIQTNGPVSSVQVVTNAASGNRSFIFHLSPTGAVEVAPHAADAVRVRFHWDSLWDKEEVGIAKPFSNWPAFSVNFSESGSTQFVITSSQLRIEVQKTPVFNIAFRDPSGYELLRARRMEYDWNYQPGSDSSYEMVNWGSVSVSNLPNGFKLKAVMEMPADEAYFGLGEFAGPLNRRGYNIQGWNQDTYYWQESRNPMYMTLPMYYGMRPATNGTPARAYGVFFNNPSRPTFRMGTQWGDAYSFEAGDGQLDYYFFGGGADHAPLDVLNRYSELIGYPAKMPRWAYGYHHSRHSYWVQHQVHTLLDQFRQYGVPLDAVYLDIGTQDNYHQMTFNAGYTNVAGLIQYAASKGVRVVPLIEPLLKTSDPMYSEAYSSLHFLKANDLSTYVGTNFLGNVSWLDFSSSFARDWWKAKMTNYLHQYPFPGIWNDLNEPNENAMALNVVYYCDDKYGGGTNNNDSRKWHQVNKNTFNVRQTSLTYDTLKTRDPVGRPFVLSRAGWPGVQAYAGGWSGDNIASWDHLRHNIRLGISVMISGQAMFGHDIGGFINHPSNEMMTRWVQWGVFNPFARAHSMDVEGEPDRPPWAFDSPYFEIIREHIRFRYELMPYLYTLAHRSTTNGTPMNTPPAFHFRADGNMYATNSQPNEYDFMVGDSLLVAPVWTEGARQREAYLPYGTWWYDYRYDTRHAGGQTLAVPASVASIPLFVREGSIIPMGPWMNYTDESAPGYLNLHVWPAASAEFTLYEDDGISTNYLAGQYASARLTSQTNAASFSFTVGARQGSFDPGERDYYIVAHDVPPASGVTLGGSAVTRVAPAAIRTNTGAAWCYDAASRRLTVKVPDTGGERAVVANYRGSETAAPAAYTSSHSNLAVAGTFNNWNEGARNMRKVTNNTWAAVLELPATNRVEFKFVANDSWSTNWGDLNQGGQQVPISGTADSSALNIVATNLAAGLYTFRFNDQTLAYSVQTAASSDSDGDGMDDEWETDYGFQPLNRNDAAGDESGSGLNNLGKYIAGLDPLSPTATFEVDGLFPAGAGGFRLAWDAVSGRFYGIWFTTNDLRMPSWAEVPGLTNLVGNGPTNALDTNTSSDLRFYRIGVRRQ
ncbi:MAG TPA: glycoside hydrolase family 31 protein [Kiritimatiellia bacterium]|nr:glycoside hydrolase family 31 protein [Kiritimatiellia bacterium]HRZ10980.1 glycoside hydrolase family 31 protein [Kiritimatiellia bacterium]HSA18553.1 glycoside hydrolase family 31 protein [Kiritimatiellia bacterium]